MTLSFWTHAETQNLWRETRKTDSPQQLYLIRSANEMPEFAQPFYLLYKTIQKKICQGSNPNEFPHRRIMDMKIENIELKIELKNYWQCIFNDFFHLVLIKNRHIVTGFLITYLILITGIPEAALYLSQNHICPVCNMEIQQKNFCPCCNKKGFPNNQFILIDPCAEDNNGFEISEAPFKGILNPIIFHFNLPNRFFYPNINYSYNSIYNEIPTPPPDNNYSER